MVLIKDLDYGTPIRVSERTVRLKIDGETVSVPAGTSVMAWTGARQRPNRIPASMALARLFGMAPTMSPNRDQTPAATIRAAANNSAPTAAG